MTTQDLNNYCEMAKTLSSEQKIALVKFSNYDKIEGNAPVRVKRNGGIQTIPAFCVNLFENIFTIDERLIANRIA